MKKEYFILCSYNNCKNKCKVFGDFCHKHRKYYCNNINYIEDDVFNYDVFKKYNKVSEWNRYMRWNMFINKDTSFNRKITIIEYKRYSYCEENRPIVLYFDYNIYIYNVLIKIYNQLEEYCLNKNFNMKIILYVLYIFYQSSYFMKFNKNNKNKTAENKSKIQNKEIEEIEETKKMDDYETNLLNIEKKSKKSKKSKKKNKKKKEKTVEYLYNLFNDKMRTFISNDYSKFTKQESKYLIKLINNILNENKNLYKNNINLYIYNSSINIYNKIEKYIEKEIYRDIDVFNKILRNVFINYKIFAILADSDSTPEDISEWKPKIESYIFDTLKYI